MSEGDQPSFAAALAPYVQTASRVRLAWEAFWTAERDAVKAWADQCAQFRKDAEAFAVVMADPGHNVAVVGHDRWQQALEARADREATPAWQAWVAAEKALSAASDHLDTAFARLLARPAPNGQALAEKVEAICNEGRAAEHLAVIAADARRLGPAVTGRA